MLEEQVLFYISGKGSARYRVTSKLILSVGCCLQNCKRLKYKVALHEPASLGHKVQREQLDLPCHRRCRQAAGPAPLLPRHPWPCVLGIPRAGPGAGELSWEMAPEGQVHRAAARHKLLPPPTPAAPSWLSHCGKPAPKHPLLPL